MMLLFSLLACLAPEQASVQQLAFLAPTITATTGDTSLEEDEVVVLGFGQSNMCSQNLAPSGFPYSLSTTHAGVTLIRNGLLKTSYGPKVPVDPFIVDELIQLGYAPDQITLVMQCAQGTSINYSRDILIPKLIEDLITFNVPEPDYVIFWQGEFEANSTNPDLSALYASDLLGIDGMPNVYDSLNDVWPNLQWSIIELAASDPAWGAPYEQQQRVRAAQHMAGVKPNVCTIPTYGVTFPTLDNPHPDLVSVEDIARRATRAFVTHNCRENL